MFCNFCGKNFDTSEGFEEITRSGHHYVRCEKCNYENQEVEYDWSAVMYGRFSKGPAGNTSASTSGSQGGRFQQRGHSGGRSAAAGSSQST